MRVLNMLSFNLEGAGASRQSAVCIILGMALLGFADNLVPVVSSDSSLWQFHVIRGVVVLSVLACLSWLGRGAIWPGKPAGVIGRGVFQTIAMLIYFGCITIMPIGVVLAGIFTAPIFVLLIEVLFLGRQIGLTRGIAIGMGFVGVVLVIQPDPAAMDWLSVLPVLGGAFYAVGAIATRSWCEGEDTLTLAFWFFASIFVAGCIGVAGLPAGGEGFVTRGWMPVSWELIGWYAVLGALALVGMSLVTRGYQVGEASIAAVYENSLLVFASFWAWALWGETVAPLAYVGMALIAVAGAIIALRDGRA